MISNVNFGTFMVPRDVIINSGSSWMHTFYIQDVFDDPLPTNVKDSAWFAFNELQRRFQAFLVLHESKHLDNMAPKRLDDVYPTAWRETYRENRTITIPESQYVYREIKTVIGKMEKDMKPVLQNFDKQKELIIDAINHNMQSIRGFSTKRTNNDNMQNNRPSHRFRKKRAPFEFISQISEKLFGFGKKKAIDKVAADHRALVLQVNNSFGIIARRQNAL